MKRSPVHCAMSGMYEKFTQPDRYTARISLGQLVPDPWMKNIRVEKYERHTGGATGENTSPS